ncbi:MAG: hypothetical protein OXN81_05005 [Alphaproteobacteria bacterium]|nr:hypothetical protein [Alphaproteobacteria bacterium]
MDDGQTETAPAEAGRAEKRNPHSIRFHDPEWERIEAFAEIRGLTGPEFVRFAVLAAVADGPAAGAAADRMAPLIERTFRAAHILVTKLRHDMLDAGREEELDELIAGARGHQDEVVGGGRDKEDG